jgi:hypothetical protein
MVGNAGRARVPRWTLRVHRLSEPIRNSGSLRVGDTVFLGFGAVTDSYIRFRRDSQRPA